MSGHNHGCDGDDNHDDTPEMGLQYSLYSKIDTGNLECLNEKIEGSGKDVFKAWEDRMNFEKVSYACCTMFKYFHIVSLDVTLVFSLRWLIRKICYQIKC
jgi:hypothetical protein